ncbi:hypothetical protein LINPERHAP2_LOCUS5771, partial [Linum perenne]
RTLDQSTIETSKVQSNLREPTFLGRSYLDPLSRLQLSVTSNSGETRTTIRYVPRYAS